MANGTSLSYATRGPLSLCISTIRCLVEIGAVLNIPREIVRSLIDSGKKPKVTRHQASREKRPLRYPLYGPGVAIPKEVPILGAETREFSIQAPSSAIDR